MKSNFRQLLTVFEAKESKHSVQVLVHRPSGKKNKKKSRLLFIFKCSKKPSVLLVVSSRLLHFCATYSLMLSLKLELRGSGTLLTPAIPSVHFAFTLR